MKMKFDFVIGNPPYQDETLGDNKTFSPPVYHTFLESAHSIGEAVEMIHPARFLFNAGNTPKAWNAKMLSDPHLKVMYYESDCKKVFPNTEIKGGIAVTYHDWKKKYDPIEIFTAYPLLNSILKKVCFSASFAQLSEIIISSYAYHFTDILHREHPEVAGQLSKGHAYDLKSNVFEKIPQVFFDRKPDDEEAYVQILGRQKNERIYKFIKRSYIHDVANLMKYKIFVPAAGGNGDFGETIAAPILSQPNVGSTESFMSIGIFDTRMEAENTLNYIKSKFARALLGAAKVTQHITPEVWKYVPLQNFSPTSDIDWSQSIQEIDRQLYKKYALSEEEIDFIEAHVQEMKQ